MSVKYGDMLERMVTTAEKNRGRNKEEHLFGPASYRQQVGACQRLVSGIAAERNYQSKAVNLLAGLLGDVERDLVVGKRTAEEMVELSVAALDLVDVDAMHPFGSIPGIKNSYYRGWGYNSVVRWSVGNRLMVESKLYMTGEEMEELIGEQDRVMPAAVIQRGEMTTVESGQVWFGRTVPLETLKALRLEYGWRMTEDRMAGNTVWVVPFRLTEEVGGLVLLATNNNGILTVQPRSELAVQEVVRGYLEAGVAKVGGEAQVKPVRRRLQRIGRDEMVERTGKVWGAVRSEVAGHGREKLGAMRKRESGRSRGEFRDSCLRHFGREFGEARIWGEPWVRLTRSGVSANQTALAIAEKAIGCPYRVRVMEGPGWYYENGLARVKGKGLLPVDAVGAAEVLLINAEPNFPDLNSEALFTEERDRLVTWFADEAREAEGETRVLVVDKTLDVDYQVERLISEWPENLGLIETMSLTKHQRGDRRYFYGLVVGYNLPEDQCGLDKALVQSRGELGHLGYANLAKVTRSEVMRRREEIQRITQEVAEIVRPVMKRYGMMIEAYAYFAYVYPAGYGELKRLALAGKDISELEKQIMAVGSCGKAGGALLDLINNKITDALGVVYGDSFNLNETRVSVLTPDELLGWKRVMERMGVLRLAPGVGADTAKLSLFLEEYAKRMGKASRFGGKLKS